MPIEHRARWQLAACYRATYLGVAVLSGSQLLEVRRHRILNKRQRRAELAALLTQLAHDYAITDIVVEPNSVLCDAACSTGLSVQTLSLAWAKEVLVPTKPCSTLPEVCEHLLWRYPRLHRLICRTPATRRLDVAERSSTATLLAVALGVVAGTVTPAQHSSKTSILNHINDFTLCLT